MADVGQELLNVPFPEMVVKLASAIAEGQYKLDLISCEIAKLMSENEVILPSLEGDGEYKTTMLGAGFQPTFYQFTDTIIEVKMAITMSKTTEKSVSAKAKVGFGCFSASVNASYSSKYSYSVEGSSLLRTKITPVPPNAFLQKYLDLKSQIMQQDLEKIMVQKETDLEEAAEATE